MPADQTDPLTLKGITYTIISTDTPASLRARGLDRVAALMEEYGEAKRYYLQRPHGRVAFEARQFLGGEWFGPRRISS